MKTTLAVLGLLVVAVGTVYTQAPPPSPNDLPTLPTIPKQNLATEPTIDQLLDRIEKIREQKAELEKQEQAAVAEMRKRMVKQTERLNKLGLGASVPPPVVNVTAPDAGPAIPPIGGLAPPLPQPRTR